MTWRFEPVSRLRCHRPSPIVRASATRVPNALPPDCTNTPPAIGAPGSGAFPVALRAPSNAPDPIKQTAAIRSPDQGHAVPCRRWTPDLCGNRPPLTALKGSWTKGGRERTVPITTTEQRDALHAAHRLAGTGSLIPANKTYIQQRHVYDGQCKAVGLSHMHDLRHQYAQSRYETLTGRPPPAAGGPLVTELSPTQRIEDRHARQTISRELGHERVQITAIYLGS